MNPMCEAGCGKHTEVYGAMYCPECHIRHAGKPINMNIDELKEIALNLKPLEPHARGIVCSSKVAQEIKKRFAASNLPASNYNRLTELMYGVPIVRDSLIVHDKIEVYYDQKKFDERVREINARDIG